MESKKMVSIEECKILDHLDDQNVFPVDDFKKVPPLIGLRSIMSPTWYDGIDEKSYLEIVDEKKWFLAKIKYGI
jgi:hypothetical protein